MKTKECNIKFNDRLTLVYNNLDVSCSIANFLDEDIVLRKIIELNYDVKSLGKWAKEKEKNKFISCIYFSLFKLYFIIILNLNFILEYYNMIINKK